MKIRVPRLPGLCWTTLAILAVTGSAQAAGLGQIEVQSWLGQPLRATIPVLGDDAALSGSCIRARLETADGAFIAKPQIGVIRGQQASSITLFAPQVMNEPLMAISITIDCGSQVQRHYQILLDPPLQAALPLTTAPIESARPVRGNASRTASKTARADLPNGRAESGAARQKLPSPAAAQESQAAPDGSDQASSASRSAAKTSRAVLRLSGDEPAPSFALKLAPTLSAASGQIDPQGLQELRAAHSRFAALMRDEDPQHEANIQARSARERTQILQAEVQVLQEQNRISQATLAHVQNQSFSLSWVVGLSSLLLASLASIGWLGWRLRIAHKINRRKWWEALTTQGGHIDQTSDSLLFATTIQPTDFMPTAGGVHTAGDSASHGRQRDALRDTATAQMPVAWHTDLGETNSPMRKLALEQDTDTATPRLGRADMITVEEISDVLQQVEFWMLLNDFGRVIDILESLDTDETPDSPVPWLYLLDAYGETGNQVKYEALRTRFERRFNVRIAPWANMRVADGARGLEDLPHLVEQICVRWGGALAVQFLENLLVDKRDGTRAGFDLPVYRDLIMLIGIATELEQAKAPRQLSYATA